VAIIRRAALVASSSSTTSGRGRDGRGDRQQPGLHRDDGTPAQRSQVVQSAVPPDRRHPPAEAVQAAREAVEVAADLRPCLRGDVLGVPADQCGQVPHQARVHVPVDQRERGLVSPQGPLYVLVTGHHLGEVDRRLGGVGPTRPAARHS
jgi:hypothetical protein